MGNIVLLDDLTINKIAAGEVIERPASVVKEMMENSIDAKSKNISVEIKNGGISYIKITDDGCGISEDDMEIAFERHATSKIRSADDLNTVMTMGFRGEALASIAAIANVEMISKKEGEEIGHKIIVEGGKVLEKSEVGCPNGTTITVRNLFFNTPVRYKFLKKDYTEAGYIEDTVKRLAIVNKNISIKLISNGKSIFQTNGSGDFKNIIYSIYGKDIANGICEVNYTYEDINVTGVIGKPEIAKNNRQYQMFFVNNRYVKDKTLTAAVDQSFKNIIPAGKFGFVILNIEINPQKIDVNVHPAKLEIRFEDENSVFKAIYHAIKVGLGQNENTSEIPNIVNEKNNVLENTKKQLEDKLDIKEGMTIEERINAINSMINKISPEKTIHTAKVIQETKKSDLDNPIEDIYRSGFISNKINYNNFEDDEKIIKFGNTNISSNTQEINISEINDKIQETTKVELINSLPKSEEQHEKINEQKEDILLKTEKNDLTQTNENIKSNMEEIKISEDEFAENVTNKLLEERLQDNQNTEIIDTTKVRESLKTVQEPTPEFEEMYKKTFGVDVVANRKEENEILDNQKSDIDEIQFAGNINESLFEGVEEYNQINYKFIGIAFSDYIIIEIKDDLYMINQFLAEEKIIYEKIKENYFNEENKDSQLLLLPDVVGLTRKQLDIAKENVEMFLKAGFDFEEFGDNTIKVTCVPSICENLNTKELFLDILDDLNTVAVTEIQEKEYKFIETISRKVAEKAAIRLDIEDIGDLMKDLLKLNNPFIGSSGKSIAIKMSKYDLERKFSRK